MSAPRSPVRATRRGLLLTVLVALTAAGALMWSRLAREIGAPAAKPEAIERPAAGGVLESPPNAVTALGDAVGGAALVANTSGQAGGPGGGAGGAPTAMPAPSSSQVTAPGGGICPPEMLHVEGLYCPIVAHRCASYLGISPEAGPSFEKHASSRRCAQYRNDLMCDGRPMRLNFCIDRFEYPNLSGVKPAVMVSYREAKRACAADGKRLCEAEEWTFACEGPTTLPYPTGLERDAGACNIDRRPRRADPVAFANAFDVSVEVARLDQRMPSGALACKSPSGAIDMTGNVSEWVHDREGRAAGPRHRSALAGGHWERAIATCRRLDGSHRADFRSHQTGFRCCGRASNGRKQRRLLSVGSRLRRRRKILKEAK